MEGWEVCAVIMRGILTAMAAVVLLAVPAARGDSTYDWLAGTQWYVPAANMLAYRASVTDLSTTLPISDQTLWNITTSSNGLFSGSTQATLTTLGIPVTTTATMDGIVTPGGQIRIIFTPNGASAGGPVTVGIGQMRDLGLGLGQQVEMQMLTGSGLSYVTHWAYMTQIPGAPFTPPDSYDGTLLSTEWAWMDGTSWNLSAPGVFGTADAAEFSISGYRSGYFWGTGVAPDGGAFTHIGSVTPEGNVLFNVLVDGTLTNLTGLMTGNAATGAMALRGYVGTDDFGDAAVAAVVPEPGAWGLLTAFAMLAVLVARVRRKKA
jgi:hypothetical protein